MIYKFALTEVTPLERDDENPHLMKTASKNGSSYVIKPNSEKGKIIEAEIKKHPTALFFRCKAIKADEVNNNGDFFSEAELLKSYKTFEGVPFFTNHDNQNVENAKGKIIHAEWVPDEKAVYTIAFIDREAYPNLCRSIEEEYVNGVSMGAAVEASECSICSNVAYETSDYCYHIKNFKGRKFSGRAKNVKTGQEKVFDNEPVYEINTGLKFIELSAVVDPACPSCRIDQIFTNEDFLKKVASCESGLNKIKTAMLQTEASQQELDEVEDSLKTLENIAINIIKNRQNIEMEFATDLVEILSKLQEWLDEITAAGYGNYNGTPDEGNVSNEEMPEEMPESELDGIPSRELDSQNPEIPGVLGDDRTMAPNPQESMIGNRPMMPNMPPRPPQPRARTIDRNVGNVSGNPTKPMTQAPSLPISAPIRPKQSNQEQLLTKIANWTTEANKIIDLLGDETMARRTLANKKRQKEAAKAILQNSWEEKQEFFSYLKEIPPMTHKNVSLDVKNYNDNYVVVASCSDNNKRKIWKYEDFSAQDRDLIKKSPTTAAMNLMDQFMEDLKTREGANRMRSDKIVEAGDRENEMPDQITQGQLDGDYKYHQRKGEEPSSITQKQLDERRKGEQSSLTEKQLESGKISRKLEEPDQVTQGQLGIKRKDGEYNEITQGLIDSQRTGEPNTLTEDQLEKTASEHMDGVLKVLAETSLKTGATPDELYIIAKNLVDSQKSRYALLQTLNESGKSSQKGAIADHTQRLAYWSSKNIKLASLDSDEISNLVVSGLKVLACDKSYEIDTLIDAIDVLSEDKQATLNAINDSIDNVFANTMQKQSRRSTKDSLREAMAVNKVSEADKKQQLREARRMMLLSKLDENASPEDLKKALERDKDYSVAEKARLTRLLNKLDENASPEDLKKALEKDKDDPVEKARLTRLLSKLDTNASPEDLKKVLERDKDDSVAKEANKPKNKTAKRVPDAVIEASFDEVGITAKDLKDPSIKKVISSFAKGALASRNVKLAAVTNVIIDGDTISIAVQTDNGEQSVQIPVGDTSAPAPEEMMPEGDMTGDQMYSQDLDTDPTDTYEQYGRNDQMGAPENQMNYANRKKRMSKVAQSPVGGGIPGTPGGVSAPGAPEQNLPPSGPASDATLDALTLDDGAEMDEIPTAGEQQMPYAICPECGSNNVDISAENGDIKGKCNDCGAEYEALVKKTVEFKIIKPTESEGDAGMEQPEAPEVPALPVAAQTLVNKKALKRMSSNRRKFGQVCPACGMTHCKVASKSNGVLEYTCPACNTKTRKELLVNANNVDEGLLQVSWDVRVPTDCDDCKKKAQKIASKMKLGNMIKTAQYGSTAFPMANCVERIARRYGGNAIARFGPCKGKALSDCVCNQLEKLSMTKVRHLEKLAAASMQDDPMDQCIQDQIRMAKEKDGMELSVVEAKTVCNCLKKEFASEHEDNIFVQAWGEDVKSGVEKVLTASDLEVLPDVLFEGDNIEEEALAAGKDLGDIDLSEDTFSDLEDPNLIAAKSGKKTKTALENNLKKEKVMSKVNREILRSLGKEILKEATKIEKVEDIENNVDAGVPRGKASIGNESPDNIDVAEGKPDVPRKKSTMGNEGPDNIDVPEKELDVPVDSSYMGHEKKIQEGMPEINKQMRGRSTSANTDEDIVVLAGEMDEVDTIENSVDAGVPRGKATMGNEGPDNIDVKEKEFKAPRGKATMGNEGPDNIDVKENKPDVPMDDAYMGHEKEQYKNTEINKEYHTRVQQSRETQMERIAQARKMEAIKVASKFLASNRIPESAYDKVISALENFKIDEIASAAEEMFPVKQASSFDQNKKLASKDVYSGPAVIIENGEGPSEVESIADCFTVGSEQLDRILRSQK